MRSGFDSWVGKIHWRREWPPIPVVLGFPCSLAGKESACNEGDLGLIPGLGRSPGEGKRYPLQYSGLENSTVYIVNGVAKSWTWLRGRLSLPPGKPLPILWQQVNKSLLLSFCHVVLIYSFDTWQISSALVKHCLLEKEPREQKQSQRGGDWVFVTSSGLPSM